MLRAVAGAVLMALVSLVGAQPPADKEKEKEKEKKWDVAADLGPVSKVAFDTTEGTWMNLDVSPDGRRIVFDLLGDIYVMPLEGTAAGRATRLTSGPAYDMQPRFSPDGIAFSTDRDGLWNIWTIDTGGKDAKQISRERRWFVNSPTWSPDGAYIFARRHFVKERSLGAGEIWMFHASGASDGLQGHERLGERAAAAVYAARSHRRAPTSPDDGAGRRLQSRPHRAGGQGNSGRGRPGAVGAHGQLQGLGAHWEMWMLQQGGMTPMEALRAATIDGARYLGLEADIGSLEKGKLADLVVLDRNPLENIRNSEAISMVMLNGRLYEAKTLNEIGNRRRQRLPFWFEGDVLLPSGGPAVPVSSGR